MHKRGSRKIVKRSSSRTSLQKKAAIKLDKKKMWLVFGISILIIVVLFLALYSPAREAVFGKGAGIACYEDSQCPDGFCTDGICTPFPKVEANCTDQFDNDNDGSTDCMDVDCSNQDPQVCQETFFGNKIILIKQTGPMNDANVWYGSDLVASTANAACQENFKQGAGAIEAFPLLAWVDTGLGGNDPFNSYSTYIPVDLQEVPFRALCYETDCNDDFDNDRDGFTDCLDSECYCFEQLPGDIGVIDSPLDPQPLDPYLPTDTDRDSIPDLEDNCPTTPNPQQEDYDGDLLGNACDNCQDDSNPDQLNSDVDFWGDACDNCPFVDNDVQRDTDGDGIGDACEEICDNNIDDDGNGLIDCADRTSCDGLSCGTGCECGWGIKLEVACDDGLDNNNDGSADCMDSSCIGKVCNAEGSTCTESYSCGEFLCNNYLDDDADGLTDCADPDCTDNPVCIVDLLGDKDGNGCLSVTEYNDFKYEYKNGLLPDVTVIQYNDLKYEFKNNVGNIVCP